MRGRLRCSEIQNDVAITLVMGCVYFMKELKKNKPRSQLKNASFLDDGSSVTGDTRPEVSAPFRDGSRDGRSLHFTLGVDNNAGVILKVQVGAVLPPPCLALAHDDGGHHLFPQLRLSLLDGAHHKVARRSSGEPVKTSLDVRDGDNVEVLCARVIGAVHERGDGETERHLVFVAGGGSASTFRGHFVRLVNNC